MKIGLFGGSFNPVHNGHLFLAEWVRVEFNLDKIIFIPSFKSPLKERYNVLDIHRVNMIKLAIKNNANFHINTLEIERKNNSYTIDTINILKEKYKSEELYFILGSDSLNSFHLWKDYKEILKKVKIICVKRMEQLFEYDILYSNMPYYSISSTLIRDRIKKGLSVRYMLKNSIIDYIEENGLYGC